MKSKANKISTMLLTLTVMLAVLVLPAAAETVSVGNPTVAPGATTSVAIQVGSVTTDIAAATVVLAFNPAVVTVDSVTAGDLGAPTTNTAVAGQVTISVFTTTAKTTAPVTIANVVLKGVAGAAQGATSALTLTVNALSDSNGVNRNPGAAGITNGVATIGAAGPNPRVYDEKLQPAIGSANLQSYKWDAQSYQGFWYDLKTGATSETLEIGGPTSDAAKLAALHAKPIDHTNRNIPEKTLVYTTVRQAIQYKVNEKTGLVVENGLAVNFNKIKAGAGYYAKIGWMGEEYVALNGQAKKLAKLVLEQGTASSDKKTLTVGESWDMGDGYTLTAQAIDAKATPRQAWLVLSRGGVTIDNKVVNQGTVYTYVEKSIGGESDVPIFVTYVDSVFAGATTDMVQLKYTWLVSKDVTVVNGGDTIGVFKVKDATTNQDTLWNEDSSVDLSVDSTVKLAGNFLFRVADDSTFLRFTPARDITAAGTYEFRGTVHDEANALYANLLSWNAQTFEGFWYDLKTGSSSETLSINNVADGADAASVKAIGVGVGNRNIAEKTLVYKTVRQSIQYKVNEKTGLVVENGLDVNFNKIKAGAGYYAKIGWMGQEYVALNGQAKKLAKLVMEQGTASSDKKTLTVGESWDMGDGYTLTAQAIDAKATPRQAWLVLSRGGVTIDNKVVNQGTVYTYVEKSIGGESDVPIFVTYVDSVFAGATTDMVQLKYTWLVSKDVTLVNGGDKIGVFKVKDATTNQDVLWNEDSSVDLSVDSTVSLAANMNFRIADDANNLRFYPMVLRIIGGGAPTGTGTGTATVTATVTGTGPKPTVTAVVTPTIVATTAAVTGTAKPPAPTATTKEPGFEAGLAIAGLLAVAFLVLRQRK